MYSWIRTGARVYIKWKGGWRDATITENPQQHVEEWTVLVAWKDTKRIQAVKCEDCQRIKESGEEKAVEATAEARQHQYVPQPSSPTNNDTLKESLMRDFRYLNEISRSSETGTVATGGQSSGCSAQESPAPPSNRMQGVTTMTSPILTAVTAADVAVAASPTAKAAIQLESRETGEEQIKHPRPVEGAKTSFKKVTFQLEESAMIPTGISTRESAKQKPASKITQMKARLALRAKLRRAHPAEFEMRLKHSRPLPKAVSPSCTVAVARKTPTQLKDSPTMIHKSRTSSPEATLTSEMAQLKDPPQETRLVFVSKHGSVQPAATTNQNTAVRHRSISKLKDVPKPEATIGKSTTDVAERGCSLTTATRQSANCMQPNAVTKNARKSNLKDSLVTEKTFNVKELLTQSAASSLKKTTKLKNLPPGVLDCTVTAENAATTDHTAMSPVNSTMPSRGSVAEKMITTATRLKHPLPEAATQITTNSRDRPNRKRAAAGHKYEKGVSKQTTTFKDPPVSTARASNRARPEKVARMLVSKQIDRRSASEKLTGNDASTSVALERGSSSCVEGLEFFTPPPRENALSSCVEDFEFVSPQLTLLYALSHTRREAHEVLPEIMMLDHEAAASASAIHQLEPSSNSMKEDVTPPYEKSDQTLGSIDLSPEKRSEIMALNQKAASSAHGIHDLETLSNSVVKDITPSTEKSGQTPETIDLTADSEDEALVVQNSVSDEGSESSSDNIKGQGRKCAYFAARKIEDSPMRVGQLCTRNRDSNNGSSTASADDNDDDGDDPIQPNKIGGIPDVRRESAKIQGHRQEAALTSEKEQEEKTKSTSAAAIPVSVPTRRSTRKTRTVTERDLNLRRRIYTTFHVSGGMDQCDPEGVGCISRRDIEVGEEFIDPYAIYKHGEPPGKVACPRGSYIKTKEGYFALVPSTTEWINAPSHGRKANISFRARYDSICGDGCIPARSKKLLLWKVVRPVKKGEEILAEYGGIGVDDSAEVNV